MVNVEKTERTKARESHFIFVRLVTMSRALYRSYMLARYTLKSHAKAKFSGDCDSYYYSLRASWVSTRRCDKTITEEIALQSEMRARARNIPQCESNNDVPRETRVEFIRQRDDPDDPGLMTNKTLPRRTTFSPIPAP